MKIYTATDGKFFTDSYDRDTYNDLLKGVGRKKEIISLALELYCKGELSTKRLLRTLYKQIVK